ncbi:peroxisomal biogenesis factor 11-domain-containing protein [Xylaria bambusicola]|uniref:peroxisomal biogenesis factor 11-domain-containing protein n=1 Tax=Xylaria bambusicola TaxID=326684 RepID=UPI0020077E27|nr:peroxisomal biogenesis factor 11-domain-containing protein [Xylaria bambusicola]KAI0517974.1 peroxisomal biogenesis factor 11-domain-containing protein [Xylaria bambusicola]
MSSHTFEQFVRFTTDAAGLERTFRLFQATAQILSSYTLPFNILLLLLSFLPSTSPASTPTYPDAATTHAVLVGLRTRFNLARRYFRLFRFLESFHAAQKLYASISSGPTARGGSRWGDAPLWIDVFGRSFNGMYLLLEASTILDVQRIDGLAVWGPELEPLVAVEGQRFWLFSLVCGVLAGLLRIADLVVPYVPAKQVAVVGKEGESVHEKGESVREKGEIVREKGEIVREKSEDEKAGGSDKKAEVDQLVRRQEVRSQISNLGRRVVSDALDITLPGSVVGWVPASTGTVGLAMFVTTILTSMDIWERCGREVANSRK